MVNVYRGIFAVRAKVESSEALKRLLAAAAIERRACQGAAQHERRLPSTILPIGRPFHRSILINTGRQSAPLSALYRFMCLETYANKEGLSGNELSFVQAKLHSFEVQKIASENSSSGRGLAPLKVGRGRSHEPFRKEQQESKTITKWGLWRRKWPLWTWAIILLSLLPVNKIWIILIKRQILYLDFCLRWWINYK